MTVTNYIESMLKSFVVTNTINFNTRGDHAVLSREDLEQEAMIVLAEVFENYRGRPEAELRTIGNRAVKNRIRDLYFRENATTRGGVGNRILRKKGQALAAAARVRESAVMVDVDITETEIKLEPQQLERLLIREAVDNVVESMTAVERRATRALLSPDEFRPHRPRRSTFLAVQAKLRTV